MNAPDYKHTPPESPSIPQSEGYFLAAHCDLNGVLRGKRVPAALGAKLQQAGMRMPMSSIGVDIWGTDVLGNDLFDRGDLDGVVEPTGRGPIPLAWGFKGPGAGAQTGADLARPMPFLPMWMRLESGAPFFGDPRRVLADVVARFAARGLRPVVALEIEFHLIRDGAAMGAGGGGGAPPQPLIDLPAAHLGAGDTIYSLDELAEVEPFLDAVYAQARACDIALEAVTAESGPSQYEFNLLHGADPLKLADDAVYLKQIIRNTARRFGWRATFMAKPYMAHAGNGLHMHFSLIDAAGRNVFDDGGLEGTPLLRHAVAGLLTALHDTALIFAPHRNSARRLQPGSLAPVNATWGYENRTAAIRIPGGASAARRIEHRVAGADANPYLVIAAVLAAAEAGLAEGREPAPHRAGTEGKTGDQANPETPAPAALPPDWRSAIATFETSPLVAALFPADFIRMFASCKRQELAIFETEISALEYRSYLHTV